MIKLGKSFNIFQNSEEVMHFAWINGASFEMGITGSSKKYLDQDYTLFRTGISKNYWISQYPITQSQWQKIGFKLKNWHDPNKINSPIYGVNWLEAMEYCKALNAIYQNDIPNNYHFSLPTELHWEYACRNTLELFNNDIIPNEENRIDTPNFFLDFVKEPPNSVEAYPYLNERNVYCMLSFLSEWCFDIAAYYGEDETWDWMGNQETYWIGDSSHTRRPDYRSIRGSTHETGFREYVDYYFSGFQVTSRFVPSIIGFRVCLRPITAYDLGDPILKKYQINMLS